VNRLERAALHVAWRRWPVRLRDERRREWEAELAVLASEPDRGPLARSVGRLRFALSLAWSPPVEDEHGVPRGWHEVLPGLGRAVRAPLALMATALMGWAAVAAVAFAVRTAMTLISDGGAGAASREGIDWFGTALNVVVLVGVAVVGTGLFGRWLGRRLPMNWAHRGRMSDLGSAVVVPMVLGALFLGVDRLSGPDIEQGPGVVIYLPDVLPAVLVWVVSIVVVAAAVVRLIRPRPPGGREPERPERPGPPGLAWLVGLGGGALALSLAGIVAGLRAALRVGLDPATAPLWTFQALLFPYDGGPAYGPRSQGWVASEEVVGLITYTVRSLLLATVLTFAYVAVARPGPAAVRLPDAAPAGIVRRRPARLPLAVAASGVLLWAYTLTVLTPQLVALDRDQFFGQLHMQAHDIRLGALLVVLLGFVAAVASRGSVVAPAVFSGVALLTADTVVDRADLGGPVVFAATVGFGLAILAAAARFGAWLGRTQPAPDVVNRTWLGVAVLAAWCAPSAFTNANQLYDARLIPLGLLLGVGLSAAALLLLAAVAVRNLAARWTPPLVAVLALGVVLAALAWQIPELPSLTFVSALAPLTVTLTLAAARWDTGRRWIWLPVTLGALVIGIPAVLLQLMPALLVGGPLMEAAGYGNPPDGMLMVPGAVLAGLGLAVLLAVVVIRRPATVDLRVATAESAVGRHQKDHAESLAYGGEHG
jgi:hypothetical protein